MLPLRPGGDAPRPQRRTPPPASWPRARGGAGWLRSEGIAMLTLPRTHVMFDGVAGRSYPEGANLAAVNRARRRV